MSQIQLHTAEQGTVSSNMPFLQRGEIFLFGISQQGRDLPFQILIKIIGCHTHQQDRFGGIPHGNSRISRSHISPFRQDDADTRGIAEAFHLQRIDTVRQLPLHQKVITVGRHLIMFGTVHPKREVQRPIRIGSQMNHPQIIGKRGKDFAVIRHLSPSKRSCCNRVVKIQFSSISEDRIGSTLIIVIQHEVT